MSKVKMTGKELKCKGVYISFYKTDMQFEDGSTAKWDYIHHPGAAAMVAETSEGKILMIRQYRPGVDKEILEIPAGGLNEGEEPIQAAIRELSEETGAVCGKVSPLMVISPSPAYNDEKVYIFWGKVEFYTNCCLDLNEYVCTEQYTLPELLSMISNGEIQDAKTIAAIFAYQNLNK